MKRFIWIFVLALLAYGMINLVGSLSSSIRQPSFAILRIQDGWKTALFYLLAVVGIICGTSYLGKLWGQWRRGRPVKYLGVLSDQLTHLFIWIVIVAALYPIFFVVATSLDPLNRLTQPILGTANEPLLIRARVIPSFIGSSFSNYAALFDGVKVYFWQWLILAIAGLATLVLAGLWALTQRAGGRPTPSLRKIRSFSTWTLIGSLVVFFAVLMPAQFSGFSNASKFLLWIRNTLVISTLSGLIAVGLTTTAGYAMARLRFPGRFQALLFFIFVQMFPGFLALVAIYTLMRTLGLTNTFSGLILAYSGSAIAFGTWLYKGYVESLPASLEEAGLVDGCTRWTAFWRIVLPLSGPMLVFIFLNQFISSYAEFMLANILLTGAENWNVGVGLRSFVANSETSQMSVPYGIFAAAAVLGSLPIVGLFYGFQQVFVSGTLSGGVKE